MQMQSQRIKHSSKMADLRLASITEDEINPYTLDANSQIVEKI